MSIYADRELAGGARKLAAKGLKGKAIADALKADGVGTYEANVLAAVGREHEYEDAAALTADELAVLKTLAAIQRERREQGDMGSPKAKHIAWRLRWSDSKVRRVTSKRLNTENAERGSRYLGFLHHSLNGHVWLTAAGWALVRATEA